MQLWGRESRGKRERKRGNSLPIFYITSEAEGRLGKGGKGIGGSCSIASVYSGIWIWILLLYMYRNIRHGITVHSAAITLHTRIFNQNSARLFFASLFLLLSASASLYNFCACISACCSSIYSPASPPPPSSRTVIPYAAKQKQKRKKEKKRQQQRGHTLRGLLRLCFSVVVVVLSRVYYADLFLFLLQFMMNHCASPLANKS